jgi:uncharacterized protein with HEPN domain
MLSNSAAAALRDIAHHIELATRFAAGFDYETFQADLRTVYAVTRCLEIISEASRRLPDDLKARHPSIAWKDSASLTDKASTRAGRSFRPSSCPRAFSSAQR